MYLCHVSHHIPSLNLRPTQGTRRLDTLRDRLHEHVYELIHRQTIGLGQFPDPQRGLFPDREGVPTLFWHRSSFVACPYKFDRSIIWLGLIYDEKRCNIATRWRALSGLGLEASIEDFDLLLVFTVSTPPRVDI
jgi:hypothetical protein